MSVVVRIARIDFERAVELPQTVLKGDRVVDGTRRSLHLDGAVKRIDDARKIRQQAGASRADDPPTMRRD